MEEIGFVLFRFLFYVLVIGTGEAVAFAITLGRYRPTWERHTAPGKPHLEVWYLLLMALGLGFWVGLAILIWTIVG